MFINRYYKKVDFIITINIIVFRIFLFVFDPLFLSFRNLEILVSKIISHMGENL